MGLYLGMVILWSDVSIFDCGASVRCVWFLWTFRILYIHQPVTPRPRRFIERCVNFYCLMKQCISNERWSGISAAQETAKHTWADRVLVPAIVARIPELLLSIVIYVYNSLTARYRVSFEKLINSSSACQEILRILWNPKVHGRVPPFFFLPSVR